MMLKHNGLATTQAYVAFMSALNFPTINYKFTTDKMAPMEDSCL